MHLELIVYHNLDKMGVDLEQVVVELVVVAKLVGQVVLAGRLVAAVDHEHTSFVVVVEREPDNLVVVDMPQLLELASMLFEDQMLQKT